MPDRNNKIMNSVQVVDVGVSRIQGDRDHQEDRYVALVPGTVPGRKDLALFAIYDGHGGDETVNHVHKNLLRHLDIHLPKVPSPSAERYKIAIQAAFTAEDQELSIADLGGGSTVTIILIDVVQKLLIEANLGDSYAVFADSPKDSEEGWNVEVLSQAHEPDGPDEKKRIERAGGMVTYTTGIPRIGGISMSRALGDLDYKLPRVNRLAGHNLSDLAGVETGLAPGKTATANIVSNQAYFAVRQLTGKSLILLASDGVGESTDAFEETKLAIEAWKRGDSAKTIAEAATMRAAGKLGADNCTVVIVGLDTEGEAMGGKIRVREDSMDWGFLEIPTEKRSRRRSSVSYIKDSLKSLRG